MTMLDTLFGLIPAGSRGQQWVAGDLQLINWGGYDGAHRVRFSPEATLLCGGSGSGKSTLMDAYIALMMPHTTPFNGASNGGVTGRPRGEEQRNILSYGRGKLDESRTDEGTHVRVLRGDGEDTWTAIAMTWTDHDDSQFTAVRAWYIPATARILDDAVKVRATYNGPFDITTLEQAVAMRLSDAAVRATGLDTYPTDREFTAKLHQVLGIGAAGAGAKAMSLLARIQAGQQITTVDELYKRMVLEEPETLATADAVVAHFDELEGTRQRMVTAQKQVQSLRPIRGMRTQIEASADRLRLIDEIGRFGDETSLATLWRTERRLELLREVESELQQRKQAADAEARSQQALASATQSELDGLDEVYRNAGGDQIERAERDLRRAEHQLETVTQVRTRFDEVTAVLARQVETESAFTALAAEAREALADPHAKERARQRYAETRGATTVRNREKQVLEAERQRLTGQRGNIPVNLLDARELLAEAAGLSLDDLPFVGELIEVRTEFEPWREAFNLALGGFATTLLIDTAHLHAFRVAINEVSSPMRLRYEGVSTGPSQQAKLDIQTLPGRLEYRDTPFTASLIHQLERRFGYLCVDSAERLSQHAMALTITGQLSRRSSGAHGGHGKKNVLGFSSHRRLTELADEIETAEKAIAVAETREAAAERELDELDAKHLAYDRVRDLTWEQIDTVAAEQERDNWRRIVAELVQGAPNLDELRTQISLLREKHTDLVMQLGHTGGVLKDIAEEWASISDEVDAAQDTLDRAEEAGRALSEAQAEYLSERLTVSGSARVKTSKDALRRFDAALDTASRVLVEDQALAQHTLEEQRAQLQLTLERFLESWPNPNLRADAETSLGDFERILEDLETSGLHELENEWKQSLIKMSGNDLTNLDSTLGRSLREIRERIEPINRIMQDLPFYDDEHRLQISPRQTQSEARKRFLSELREVRKLIEVASSDTERTGAYERMAKLIGRIRRTAPDFADLIDVRNHVRVSAEKVRADTHEHAALYDHIGEKSGGESQELIAFIVGAALRYQLGDADAERPRYAPVFLDEALIKADAHFTKRAIGAWRGLGFQLIIGAPNDKYSAIEPHIDVEYDILKDTQGRSWARPKVALSEPVLVGADAQ